MKSIVLVEAPDRENRVLAKVAVRDLPKPTPGPEDVLIRVAYASICGSDNNILKGNVPDDLINKLRIVLKFQPFQIGHEISGVIEAVGAKAKLASFRVGDRVTANYTQYCNSCYYCRTGQENFCERPVSHMDAMSEYVCWHMSQIYKIPDDVSLLDASQTEPLTIGMNAAETARVHLGSRVFVSGAGPIGLYAVMMAKLAGASKIVVSDIVTKKQEIALACGADAVVNPMEEGWQKKAMKLSGGKGFDSIIESSGAPSAANSMLDLLSKNGHLVMMAMYPTNFEWKLNPYQQLYEGGKHIHGMYTSADLFPRAVAMLKSMDFSKVIDKVVAPEDCEEAFAMSVSGEYSKIVFKFSDDE